MAWRLLASHLDNTIRQEVHLGSLFLPMRYLSNGKFERSNIGTNSTEEKRDTLVKIKENELKQSDRSNRRTASIEDKRNTPAKTKENELKLGDRETAPCSSDDDGTRFWKWKLQDTWLARAIESALQMFKGVATDGDSRHKVPPGRSFAEIFSDLQRSKIGLQDWTLGDLTVGLYLVYLRQASVQEPADVKGVPISSDLFVEDLIYDIELAKGAYKGNSAGLARHSMIQEKNVLKFIKDSSVMRPGYYIAIDMRKRLVVFGLRGTHTVSDIITDVISSSNEKDVLLDGFSTHFGTSVAARWFLHHEMHTINQCMNTNKGFRLRLVGHSLGGATASLLAIMLRKKSMKELGFDPCLVSAIGFGTPPCLSKDLARNCSNFVSTVVMQDDIIPRLSVSSLTRLRNEIIETDWTSILEKEDWGTVLDWISNAKQAVSSIQDIARRLSDHAKLKRIPGFSGDTPVRVHTSCINEGNRVMANNENEELFVPGEVYYLKKQADDGSRSSNKNGDAYQLLRMHAGEQTPRILLSGNLISDHRCDSHYHALREVLKQLPVSDNRTHPYL